MTRPRVVLVRRRTELEELLDRHGTRGQAEFFLRSRGRRLGDVQASHDALAEAIATVLRAVPSPWSRTDVERGDLDRFLFGPGDVVVVVGQDGLVANAAKYLADQPVVGVDPDPGRNPGVLVPFSPGAAAALLPALEDPEGDDRRVRALATRDLTTAWARTDDGQELTALNEVFVGHPSHQSARYLLLPGPGDLSHAERQSSSGVVVSTGTGATGWSASITADRGGGAVPGPTERRLAWSVREAWPSPSTGRRLTQGTVEADGPPLRVIVASDELVVFGDGMEGDRLRVGWGQEVTLAVGPRALRLAIAPPRSRR